jgi:nitrite reductase/ring-hydroxylating ferredoxin subunit
MVAVIAVTQEERPALGFILQRLIPVLRRETPEDQEVAAHLAYALGGLEQAPPGPGELEFVKNDLYTVGTHIYAVGCDLEEYWLDRVQLVRGQEPPEPEDPEVAGPARLFFSEVDAAPLAWSFNKVEPQFIDLGFKFDRALTAEAPQARALYNKARVPINRAAVERRERNAALRGEVATVPGAKGIENLALPAQVHEEEEPEPAKRPRPVGSAQAPAGRAAAGLTTVSAATYPTQYLWGVEVGTGVNADDLEPGKPRKVNIGGAEVILVNVDGKVVATARTCPHRGWSLASGCVENGVITCSLHGAQFDAFTGEVLRQPYDPGFNREHRWSGGMMKGFDPKRTTTPLQTYPTIVADDGEVRVHI